MEYVLTEHARDALEKRRIQTAWLERVLNAPEVTEADPVDPDLEHRLACIGEFGGRVLRVIVNTNRTPPHVVTAFFDRRRTLP
ncbi:MAG: DUF4258 domain-containing protein [Gammaproteobacteria bacterium]|jgi:uncharacterized DUF497 family protein|nr:DUF4258 domain-containing protein [Gammaproteobacteria bacterium]